MGVIKTKRWEILVTLIGCGLIASGPLVSPLKPGALLGVIGRASSELLTAEATITDNVDSSNVEGLINDTGAMSMDATSSSVAPLACDPTAVFIRPASYTNPDPGTGTGCQFGSVCDSVDAGLTNPNRAIDNDHFRSTQASAESPGYRCLTHCGGAKITYGCRWFNFPAGYTPRELRVKWWAQGSMEYNGQGDVFVQAKICYSTDGGQSWTEMDGMTWHNEDTTPGPPSPAYPSHEVSVPIAGIQPQLVQVRATLCVTLCCSGCLAGCDNFTQVTGGIYVSDIGIMADQPGFQLFLDVPDQMGNYDFDPNNPQSDIEPPGNYVPGVNSDGTIVPVPSSSSGTIQQALRVIAAYKLPNGLADPAQFVAVPESGCGVLSSQVCFQLKDTSAFRGIAMNYGNSLSPDFAFAGVTCAYFAGKTATVVVNCKDYGGFTRVEANRKDTAGAIIHVAAPMRIPKDDDGNLLPDGGWIAGTTQIQDFGMAAGNDEDNNGPNLDQVTPQQPPSLGRIGDGLLNFEEYRGFVVRGEHRRTNPFHKDLFISSDLLNGISYAYPNLPTATHRVKEDGSEYNTNRVINFNYTNSGYGGPIPGHINYDQNALKILKMPSYPGNPTVLGATYPLNVINKTPNETDRIEVYENPHASLSDPDHEIRRTTGHEVGHGINVCHRPDLFNACFNADGTVVGTDDSIMSSALGPWTNYNNFDQGQIRLHVKF